ncbi:hypothetical protein K466DRAFT_593634, partial [Polyporus arcularius HHB13444]
MFSQLLRVAVAVAFVGQTVALPTMPMPMRRELDSRQTGSFETIQAYRRAPAPAVNTMPVDVATMSKDGNIVLFENTGAKQRRSPEPEVNTMPVDVPTMSQNGKIVLFNNPQAKQRREPIPEVNTMPVDVPTMSQNGKIVLFNNPQAKQKRAPAVNTMP